MKREDSREHLFEEEFARVYGERWPRLKASLLEPSAKTVLKNPFSSELQDYTLDAASVAASQALDVQPGMEIADFCASPGGKSIAAMFRIFGEANWHLNDISPARGARLRAVLHDCLPPQILRRVRVYTSDGSRWGLKRRGEFDRVLVDAPCSGERHLMASPEALARWSIKAVKGLVVRQHALLCSALDSTKPGGAVVYSTCAIHPFENDGVIEKLLKSREGQFKIAKLDGMGEATFHGRIVLPDVCEGAGPIYFARLEKL